MYAITVRVERSKVMAAKRILAGKGLAPMTAINVFLAEVVSQKAIPFPLSMIDSEYSKVEYDMTPNDMADFDRRMDHRIAAEKKAGTSKSTFDARVFFHGA